MTTEGFRMGLTEEEYDFLSNHRGGLFDNLQAIAGGVPRSLTPVEEAHETARRAHEDLVLIVPSRTHRLLYLAATAKAATEARDKLLEELLLTMMEWHQSENGLWGWVPIAPYFLDYLADLVGLTTPTVRARYERLRQETYAKLNADEEKADA